MSLERTACRVDADCQEDGPIALLRLRPEVVFPAAYKLVLDRRFKSMDAIHVAIAVEECPPLAGNENVVFISRDHDQATVAACGLELW